MLVFVEYFLGLCLTMVRGTIKLCSSLKHHAWFNYNSWDWLNQVLGKT